MRKINNNNNNLHYPILGNMKKFYSLAFLSALLMLGSCANDAPEAINYEPDEQGNIGYIRLNIANADTRATTDEDEGEDSERGILHVDFLFVGVDGKTFNVRMPKDSIKNNQTIVPLPKMPRTVSVIVNGEGGYSDNTNLGTDKYAVDRYTKKDYTNEYFYMSSSKYWNNDANHTPVYRTSIAPSQVFKSHPDAKKGASIPVTVERYVAKVKINYNIELDANKELNPIKDKTPDGEDIDAGKVTFGKDGKDIVAVVSFKPEYVLLTGVNDKAYRLKNVPTWETMTTMGLQDWCNDFGGKRSFWVGETAGEVKFATHKQLKEGKAMFAQAYGNNKVFYPFENNEEMDAKKTSVAVVGKYTVTDPNNPQNELAAADGSFYLVAFEDNYVIYKTEADAIKAMGGNAETDKLVPEAKDADGNSFNITSSDQWLSWTGWMKLEKGNNVVRCIKYNGGYGYYVKEIIRHSIDDTDFAAIVRNHVYTLNLNGIGGMGIGIPDEDTPIINVPLPDPTKQNYYLNMSVKVAPWRVVKEQGVNWE